MTVYELYQNLQKLVAKIEFARDYNNTLENRHKEIYNNSLSDDELARSEWVQGYYVGRIEENLGCYIAERELWRELYDIVKDFTESPNKTNENSKIRQDIYDKLKLLKRPILGLCEPVDLKLPYCPIKEVSPHRYKISEDEAAREENKQQAIRCQLNSQLKKDSKVILTKINYILRQCEKGWGITVEKSDKYREEFENLLKPEIEYAQADKIKIDLTKFSKSPSKRLLEDLIRSPEGVTHTEKYGKKQPDGVKDILKRNRYEEAAKAVHKDGDTIKLDEKIIFSKK